MKLNYLKSEVKKLKEEIYFTDEELEILEYWNLDYSLTKIADLTHLSTRTVSRRKKSIKDKLDKIKSQ